MATDTHAVASLRDRADGFWRSRSARERAMLIAGAVVVLVGMLYGLLYAPLEAARARLADRLPMLRAEHRLLTAQVAEIERLRRQGKPPSAQGDGISRIVEASAMAFGLRESIQDMTPLGEDSNHLRAREASLEIWTKWLMHLRSEGVSVQTCTLSMSGKPGMASFEATLSRGGR